MTSQLDPQAGAQELCNICRAVAPHDLRRLPCQHAFCFSCLNHDHTEHSQRRLQSNKIQCPTCHLDYPLPEGGLLQLPEDTNTSVLDLRKRLESLPASSKLIKCVMCAESEETAKYCINCQILTCSKCTVAHNKKREFKRHLTLSVTDATIQDIHCKSHKEQYIYQFCTSCGVCVCKQCITGEHSGHTLVDFIPEKRQQTVSETRAARHLTKRLRNLQEMRDSLVSKRQENDHLHWATDQQITDHVKQVTEHIKKREDIMRTNALTYHAMVESQVTRLESEVSRAVDILEDILQTITDWEHPISSQPTISHAALLPMTRIQDKYSRIKLPVCASSEIVYKFHPVPLPEIAKDIPSELPIVKPVITEVNEAEIMNFAQLLWSYHCDGNVFDICYTDLVEHTLMIVLFSNMNRVSSTISLKDGKEQPLPPHIPSDDHFWCRMSYNKVSDTLAYSSGDKEGITKITVLQNKSHSITFPCTRNLFSLHVANSGNIYATTYIAQSGSVMTSLCCYSPRGELQWCRDTSYGSSGEGNCAWPAYISLDHMNRIIVSDVNGNSVHIFNEEGRYLLSFPGTPHGDIFPAGVSVSKQNNILVALEGPDVVSLFSPSGHFIKHLVKVDGKPRAICLLGDQMLAVGTEDGDIYMFDIERALRI